MRLVPPDKVLSQIDRQAIKVASCTERRSQSTQPPIKIYQPPSKLQLIATMPALAMHVCVFPEERRAMGGNGA